MPMKDLPKRIADKFIPEPNSGCWIWTAALLQSGYGAIKFKRKMRKAHRVIYSLLKEPIPDDLCALHKCDNPACVNPDHIFIGTHADNGADKYAKGRSARGIRNGNSILTEELVRKIRSETGSIREVGRKYSLAHSTIRLIRTRQLWRHI